MKAKIICKECKRTMWEESKGMCATCCRKSRSWKPKIIICKKCKETKGHHGKGLCPNCYMKVFHPDYNRNYKIKRLYNITPELYNKITKCCFVCSFNKVVELHHLDKNHKNNNEDNLIGLCPNHHMMLHNPKYEKEVQKEINKKRKNMTKYETFK